MSASRGPAPGSNRYRWVVLAAGSAGAAAFAALRMGLPSLGPALRDAYDLSVSGVGIVLAAVTIGTIVTMVPWGLLTDRVGERSVMASGLFGAAAALVVAAVSTTSTMLFVALLTAGMLGASATGASGRAVMGWFARTERGFALGLRQMALPLGGGAASLALPWLVHVDSLRTAFLTLAGLTASGALGAALLMREPPAFTPSFTPAIAPPPVRDQRIWRLGFGTGLLISGQSAVLGFVVLFLHDARGVSVGLAAGALAAIQILGALARTIAGRRSDREGLRIAPLRRFAMRNCVLVALVAALATAPGALLYPLLLCTGVSVMAWNGLAATAAAEISGRDRAATAMSLQTMIVSVGGALSTIAFGVIVQEASWSAAFGVLAVAPLIAAIVLRPLEFEEEHRVADRERRISEARDAARALPLEAAP